MNVVSLVIIGAFAVYFVFVEYLDWRGRMEVLEAKHPLLWKAVNARPFRLILLFLIFGMLAENSRERIQEIEVEPLVVKVNAVPSPDPGAKNAEIIRLQGELASLRSKQETRAERLIASRPSRMFEVEAHDPGNLTVKHGAGCTPYHVSWENDIRRKLLAAKAYFV